MNTNPEDNPRISLEDFVGFIPDSGLFHSLVILLIGLGHGFLNVSLPRWENALSTDDSFRAIISQPTPLSILLWCFSCCLLFSVVWLLLAAIFDVLDTSRRRENRKWATIVLSSYFLPLVGLQNFIGTFRLYSVLLFPAIVLSIILLQKSVIVMSSNKEKVVTGPVRTILNSSVPVYISIVILIFILVLPLTPLIITEQPTGDEPNYLIIVNSLVTDGDIDLQDDYENEEYRSFYSTHLYHRVTVDSRDRWLPSQGIGLPILLFPFYWLGLKCGNVIWFSRLLMTLLSMICLLFCFLVLRHQSSEDSSVSILWGLSGIAGVAPWLYYSHQIYPEVGAAVLLSALMYFHNRPDGVSAVMTGISAGLLPWLGIKYIIPLSALLFIWGLHASVLLIRKRYRIDEFRHLVVLLTTCLIMVVIFFSIFYHLYGTFNFVKTHGIKGTESSGFGGSLSWALMYGIDHLPQAIRIACGYLLDQRVGILFYAPIFLAIIPGFYYGFRSRPWFHIALLFYMISHWSLFAWTGQWEGYCLPVRYLVPLVPLFIVWLGTVYQRNRHIRIMWILQLLSWSIALMILFHLNRFYHYVLWRNPDEKNHFLIMLSNKWIDFTTLFPSFTVEKIDWFILSCWCLLSILLLVLLFVRLRQKRVVRPIFSTELFIYVIVAFMSIVFLIFSFAEKKQTKRDAFAQLSDGRRIIYSMTNDTFEPEGNGIWLRGKGSAEFLLKGQKHLAEGHVSLTLHSLTDNHLTIIYDGAFAELDLKAEKAKTIMFPCSTSGFEAPGEYHSIRLRCEKGMRPSEHSNSLDRRFLGVFIRFQ